MGGIGQPFAYGSPGALPLLDAVYGLPGKGNIFHLDPDKGNDGNDGFTPQSAVKTLTKAYSYCVADQNDTILYHASVASGISLAASFAWNKNCTHLIGVGAPSWLNTRARIGHSANFSPGIVVSASGCSFRNLYVPYGRGNAGNLIALQVTGHRNYFENVHLLCGHATEGGTAGFILLDLSGGLENTFRRCQIGGTTIVRAAANTHVSIHGSAGRFLFEDCNFLSEIEAVTTPTFVSVTNAVNALQEFGLFRRCSFVNYSINQAAKLAAAFIGGPATGGVIVLDNCGFVGCTKVAVTNPEQVWIIGAEGNTAATQGLAVNPA